jgi:hypothetical protein
VIEHDYDRLSALMRKADAWADPDDPVERVRAQMYAYCEFAIANPGHYRLMLGNRRIGGGGPGSRPQGPLLSILEGVITAFDGCDRAGKRLRMPSRRAAVMVFVGTHGRVALYHSSGETDSADRIMQFVDELITLVFE